MAKVTLGSPEHRARIIQNMRAQRARIREYFVDVEHWNSVVRGADEERIDPDPDGELRKILEGLEFSLGCEAGVRGVGKIEPVAGVPGARPDERTRQ